MKIKRTIGTGKIFLYSCGAVMALAAFVWLAVNGGYAVYFYGEDTSLWANVHTEVTADVFTPWLLAVAMAVYWRYSKMCGANNVSREKQTVIFSLMSAPLSAAFAAADLISAKLVMQPLYGGIVQTRIEENSYYFGDLIRDYVYALDEDSIPEITAGAPYTKEVMILLFALMAVYYYCCFLAGGYIMQCIRCGRKKTLIYYLISGTAIFWVDYSFSHIENGLVVILIMYAMIISMLTNPAVFLYVLPMTAAGDEGTIVPFFLVMTAFILITAASISYIGSKQYPSRRKIKRVLKNTVKTEVQKNDGQT